VWRWVSTWTRSRAATRSCNSTWQCPRLANRIDTYAADLFDDEYPSGYDCLLFAHQLVIWTPAQNRTLWGKAHRALASGGRVLIFNAFSDDDGTGPLYTGLDNVYFSTLPFRGSTIYRWCDYEDWLRTCGFTTWHRSPSTPGHRTV
jgi:hypothetical protein